MAITINIIKKVDSAEIERKLDAINSSIETLEDRTALLNSSGEYTGTIDWDTVSNKPDNIVYYE